MMIISKDIGHRPMVFIRFNPDSYIDEENNNISSCWTTNKLGICIISKLKENEWKERLNVLKDKIDFYLNPENKVEKTIELVNLFYDNEM
jgi:hypothetical protein